MEIKYLKIEQVGNYPQFFKVVFETFSPISSVIVGQFSTNSNQLFVDSIMGCTIMVRDLVEMEKQIAEDMKTKFLVVKPEPTEGHTFNHA